MNCDVTSNMATPIVIWSNLEVRGVSRFLDAKGQNMFEIYEKLVAMYGVNVMIKYRVYQWCQSFKSGRTSLKDDA